MDTYGISTDATRVWGKGSYEAWSFKLETIERITIHEEAFQIKLPFDSVAIYKFDGHRSLRCSKPLYMISVGNVEEISKSLKKMKQDYCSSFYDSIQENEKSGYLYSADCTCDRCVFFTFSEANALIMKDFLENAKKIEAISSDGSDGWKAGAYICTIIER